MVLGKSNTVSIIEKAGLKYIQKTFAEKLVEYDVNWPLSRKDAECFSYKTLQTLLPEDTPVSLPRIVDSTDTSLLLEYIDAPCLSQFLSSKPISGSLPSKRVLIYLVSLLHRFNTLDVSTLSASDFNILQAQKEIAACMYHNKHADAYTVREGTPWYLCLGDVSLNNILYDGDNCYLIDFECTHLGYLGYDIGQLLGMTKAYAHAGLVPDTFCHDLSEVIDAIILNANEYSCIQNWADSFYKYYIQETQKPSH